MADRILRDELLESDRWLDLPTDAARLAFVGFILICDDFGNFEGGPRRLYRLLQKFTQIKTEEASAAALDTLMASDLIRRYQDGDRELFHIPRFKSHRQYLSRQYPKSPWCADDAELGKDKRIINKGLAKNIVTTSLPRSSGTAEGVGVGVGELPFPKPRKRVSGTKSGCDSKSAEAWTAYSNAYFNRYGVEPVRNASVNSQLAKLVDRLGAQDAPAVASYYVKHNRSIYVGAKHSTALLLRDAEGMRTEWATGQQTTDTQARKLDQGQAQGSVWAKLQSEKH